MDGVVHLLLVIFSVINLIDLNLLLINHFKHFLINTH
jgi:hypothetical protein